MKIVIGYYDSGYWWEVLIINNNSTMWHEKTNAPPFVVDIIDKYNTFNYLKFINWLYSQGFEEIIICDDGSIYREVKQK